MNGKSKENHPNSKDFSLYQSPQVPGKEWENAEKSKKIILFLATRKQGNPLQARKGRSGRKTQCFRDPAVVFLSPS